MISPIRDEIMPCRYQQLYHLSYSDHAPSILRPGVTIYRCIDLLVTNHVYWAKSTVVVSIFISPMIYVTMERLWSQLCRTPSGHYIQAFFDISNFFILWTAVLLYVLRRWCIESNDWYSVRSQLFGVRAFDCINDSSLIVVWDNTVSEANQDESRGEISTCSLPKTVQNCLDERWRLFEVEPSIRLRIYVQPLWTYDCVDIPSWTYMSRICTNVTWLTPAFVSESSYMILAVPSALRSWWAEILWRYARPPAGLYYIKCDHLCSARPREIQS